MNRTNCRQVLDCGGNRSATPLWGWHPIKRAHQTPKAPSPLCSSLRCASPRQAGLFHPLIEGCDFDARFRQGRAAAAFAAARDEDERLLEAPVHRLDERPRAHIGHIHPPGRLVDGAGPPDQREQFRLTRSQRDVAATKNAEAGLYRARTTPSMNSRTSGENCVKPKSSFWSTSPRESLPI
jgi:hypothetical protein